MRSRVARAFERVRVEADSAKPQGSGGTELQQFPQHHQQPPPFQWLQVDVPATSGPTHRIAVINEEGHELALDSASSSSSSSSTSSVSAAPFVVPSPQPRTMLADATARGTMLSPHRSGSVAVAAGGATMRSHQQGPSTPRPSSASFSAISSPSTNASALTGAPPSPAAWHAHAPAVRKCQWPPLERKSLLLPLCLPSS
jgi:hypothetical protein